MKFMKKLLSAGLALALATSVCTGCSIASGGDEVIATVNGVEITAQDMRYYLVNSNYQLYSIFLNEHPEIQDPKQLEKAFSWDAVYDEESGETYAEYSKRIALDEAIAEALKVQKAEELGMTLGDEDITEIREYADNVEEQQGDEFDTALAVSGLKSKEDFVSALIRMQTVSGLDNDFDTAPEKYITDEAEFVQYAGDDKVSAKHILVSLSYEDENGETLERTPEEALALAQKVKAKIDAGEDFDALMEQYNDDPGEPATGYTFGKGEMVEPFEKASFALRPGEVSEIVETTYGYHIIKRVVGFSEVLAKWKSESAIEINEKVYDKVPVELKKERPYNSDEKKTKDKEPEALDEESIDQNAQG